MEDIMTAPIIQRREPALVLVLSIITFGIYLPFWYHGIYEDLRTLDGRTPTGHGHRTSAGPSPARDSWPMPGGQRGSTRSPTPS